MTKAELIERIARSRDLPPDVTKKCIGEILDIAFDELSSYFAKARVTRTQSPRFTFPGFGTFTKKKRSARRGVNPRTLEPMKIAASHTIDFKPGSDLRGLMNPDKESKTGAKKKAAAKKKTAKKASTATTKKGRAKKASAVEKTSGRGSAKRKTDEVSGVSGRRLMSREEAELQPGLEETNALPDAPLGSVTKTRRSRLNYTG